MGCDCTRWGWAGLDKTKEKAAGERIEQGAWGHSSVFRVQGVVQCIQGHWHNKRN